MFALILSNVKSQSIKGAYLSLHSNNQFNYSAELYLLTESSTNLNRSYVLINWGVKIDTLHISQINFYNGLILKKYTGASCNFPSTGSYLISYEDTFRIDNIKNISNSNLENIKVTSYINISTFNSLNTFPTIQNYPNHLQVQGNQVVYNPQFTDSENDSLSYSLVPCIATNYRTPSNVTLNNQTGELHFSKDSIGVYAFSYRVDEWRRIDISTVAKKASFIYDFTIDITTNVLVKELKDSYDFSIYPNPTNSIINIIDEQNELQNSTIEIKNTLGQVVLSTAFTNQIDISHLQSGMYFLTVRNNSKKKTVKIIKE